MQRGSSLHVDTEANLEHLSIEKFSELVAQQLRFISLRPNLAVVSEHLAVIQARLARERENMTRMRAENDALLSEIRAHLPEVRFNMVSSSALCDTLEEFIEGDIAVTLRDAAHVLSEAGCGIDAPFQTGHPKNSSQAQVPGLFHSREESFHAGPHQDPHSSRSVYGVYPKKTSHVEVPRLLHSSALHRESFQAGAYQDSRVARSADMPVCVDISTPGRCSETSLQVADSGPFRSGSLHGESFQAMAYQDSHVARSGDVPFCVDISTPGRYPKTTSQVAESGLLHSASFPGESFQAGPHQDSLSGRRYLGVGIQAHRRPDQQLTPSWSQAEVSQRGNQGSRNIGSRSATGYAGRPEQARGSNGRQPRPLAPGTTTIMVRNIPARYRKERLLLEWPVERHRFNMMYLPANRRGMSLGYAFLNFVTADDALLFQRRWHGRYLTDHGANKHLDISQARVQGLVASLRDMLENVQTPEWRRESCVPLVFEGARLVNINEVIRQHGLHHLQTSNQSGNTSPENDA